MATETERKFLVTKPGWRRHASGSMVIRQAYLAVTGAASIRIRIVDDVKATLTIKSAGPNLTRSEFEYSIPVEDARDLIEMRVGVVIEKRRHIVQLGDARWEIDTFEGTHDGLVVAELELPDASAAFERPDWLGTEVTGDPRYYNATLAAVSLIGDAP